MASTHSLYVANTSKQHHVFVYRHPSTKQLKDPQIPIGSQIRVIDNATDRDIEYIVNQHVKYGLTRASEAVNQRGFVGLCYSVDDPVNIDRMLERIEQNDGALQDRSDDQRETATKAIANGLQERMQDHGVRVPRTEVEVVEETEGTPSIAVGLEVVEPGTQPRHGGERSRRGRRG